MSNNYAGIDYSGLGSTVNRDVATGIQYGVISQHSIQPDVMSDIWSEARDLSYEAAVEEMKDRVIQAAKLGSEEERWNRLSTIISEFEYADATIDGLIESIMEEGRAISKEKAWDIVEANFNDRYECDDRSWLWEKDGYTLTNCLQSDVFVSKSPYFTYAQFCSPCVPGAGNLDHPFPQNDPGVLDIARSKEFGPSYRFCAEAAGMPKVFCLGHDFFENEDAPYPVFNVATGKRVVMVEKQVECPACLGGNIKPALHEPGQRCRRCGGLGHEVKKVESEQ